MSNMGRSIINRVGEVHGILKITEECGDNKVIAECLMCHKRSIYNKSNLINEKIARCSECGLLNKKIAIGESNNHVFIISINGDTLKCKCEKCGFVSKIPLTEYLSTRCRCYKCGIPVNVESKIGQTFGKFTIKHELGNNRVNVKCERCGAFSEQLKSRVANETARCPYCESRTDTRYNDDLTGTVLSGKLVLSEKNEGDSKVCKVRCIDCGNEFFERKGRLISGQSICKMCHKTYVKAKCWVCNHDIDIIRCYDDMIVTCDNCGTKSDVKLLKEIKDIRAYVNQAWLKYKNEELPDDAIVMSKTSAVKIGNKPKYIGYDGNPYYDAVCITHFKKLILNKSEIDTYNHEQCDCKYCLD